MLTVYVDIDTIHICIYKIRIDPIYVYVDIDTIYICIHIGYGLTLYIVYVDVDSIHICVHRVRVKGALCA